MLTAIAHALMMAGIMAWEILWSRSVGLRTEQSIKHRLWYHSQRKNE